MKTFKLITLMGMLLSLLVVVRCGDDTETASLSTLSGTVKYPNTAGVQTIAPKAVVVLLGTSGTITTLTDEDGTFTFPNLGEGEYDLSASFYVEPANARLNGLNFATEADVAVIVGSDDLTQDLTLVNTGQGAEIVAMDANLAWTGSAYTQTGTWTYDQTHSPVAFEFAYRQDGADFIGAFSQLNKVDIDFDPADLANSKIDISIDVASFDTRSPGGRDPRTTVADNPPFNPNTLFTEYGCIINTVFGITADNATPSDAVPQTIANDPDRYATFVSTSIAKYGDGYLAKGNVVFHGQTVPIELWFKAVEPYNVAVSAGTCASLSRTYAGFEGKFLMDAKNDFLIDSSSLGAAIVRIQISIVLYKCVI